MHESTKVLLVGCGAVGTMCAFTLQNSRLAEVTVVLRSNFDIVEFLGFHIKSVDHGEIRNWKPQHRRLRSFVSIPAIMLIKLTNYKLREMLQMP
jgi:ketopantoate reductase